MAARSDPGDLTPGGPSVSLLELTALHVKIGLLSFGGGLTALTFQEVVARKAWLTEEEFLSGLALCQILPGVNVTNLAIYVGHRLRGIPGAVLAVTGMMAPPFFMVIGCVLIYDRLVGWDWFSAALYGVTAAAIGMLMMIVVRGARHCGRNAGALVVLFATAFAVGVLRLPFFQVVLVAVPASIGLAYLRRRGHV